MKIKYINNYLHLLGNLVCFELCYLYIFDISLIFQVSKCLAYHQTCLTCLPLLVSCKPDAATMLRLQGSRAVYKGVSWTLFGSANRIFVYLLICECFSSSEHQQSKLFTCFRFLDMILMYHIPYSKREVKDKFTH